MITSRTHTLFDPNNPIHARASSNNMRLNEQQRRPQKQPKRKVEISKVETGNDKVNLNDPISARAQLNYNH